MSSSLPFNSKPHQHSRNSSDNTSAYINENVLASSFDPTESTARLNASPVPQPYNFSTSPAKSIRSQRSYGTNSNSHHISFKDRPRSPYGDNLSVDIHDEEVAKVVRRHLVSASPSGSPSFLSTSPGPSTSIHRNEEHHAAKEEDEEESIADVHQLHGGAITHDIYKWTEDHDHDHLQAKMKRSRSMMVATHKPSDPALLNLKDPGGFRRHYVIDQAVKKGKKPPSWITRSFVDFLAMYGHFGGEDLRDEEGMSSDEEEDFIQGSDERTALLRQARANVVEGTATPTKTVFLLLKSFIGTGVMFLPKAFHNGGVLFSTLFLFFISSITLYCFLLLIRTRNKVPASFGDIGGILFGQSMRILVLSAVTISQIGFVCAYMVFVAQSLNALIEAVSDCKINVPLHYLILVQIAIFVPLAMIRKIQKLSIFALIADVFILLGLSYLYYYDLFVLIVDGIGKVEWFINPSSFPMFIGTAVFTFEGVGLIIPIAESMREPKKFPKVLSWTMLFITLLFISIGLLSYLSFGENVQTVILLNLPATVTVNSIQGLYAIAICLSIPLQLFPAIRIVETGLFSRSGKYNPIVKWQKNMFRLATVLLSAAIAIAGSGDLDKFVSLIGSICCIPLCYLFPPLFHLKAVANNWRQKVTDISIIVFGTVCMIYTTYITIGLWTQDGESAAPISRCAPRT
ncbi:transmembrane amino acid transporter protein-domain-containing protein [Cokeromyces recurvatus]|uniref:transmembrane amino acid transporter protein-domain-containing protein n=1 Tax=Cokeromyces recurvatus TaxID=90255 RepID=UPI002220BC1A|nr:transmembrane amino acid transporter protein-domain-containing protein [Cokeromyces recurvatus]KAI7900850.1 transmembrane amino acid transporter protein-domain-containing protein [Cokeromyces recurvatus]